VKNNAVIGVTGFVGSNIFKQGVFNFSYSSSNIHEIINQSFDLVVCAGVRAEKWRANLEPDLDLQNINNLISFINQITTREFILISTVDVYANPQSVYEDSPIYTDQLSPYGKHRYYLEEFVRGHFPNHLIIRLPGLIGTGLKKNFIFDLLHNPDALHLTHVDSRYQFYSLGSIWKDIQSVRKSGLPLINFATPPLSVRRIATECFGTDPSVFKSTQPVFYDMRTSYAWLFEQPKDYICSEETEIAAIQDFIRAERRSSI